MNYFPSALVPEGRGGYPSPMNFQSPLLRATLLRRYKRFLADVRLDDGTEMTVHCANPGSMAGLKEPGMIVWLSDSNNPKRKLRYSWELVEAEGQLVGINTSLPNKIVEEALAARLIPELAEFDNMRREVKYGTNSRIDVLLESKDRPPVYVEVKNVHFTRSPELAEFPDSVTARGAKHLAELSDMVYSGARGVMVYLIQRMDCERFSIAQDIDQRYGEAFDRAKEAGVEMIAYDCNLTTEEITLRNKLEMV